MAVPVTAAVPDTSDSFIWAFPGAPVRVVLDLAAVERLAAAATAGDSFAGVLFGRRTNTAVVVSDYYRVKDEPLGPWLQRAQALGLKQCCDRARDPLDPVGLLRAQAGEKLALSPDDRNLMAKFFPGPQDIVLVIRATPGDEPPVAGFFFWDGGEIFTDFCLLEFPLDATLLRASAARREMTARESAVIAFPDAPAEADGPRRTQSRKRGWGRYALALLLAACVGAATWIYMNREPVTAPAGETAIVTERLTPAPSVIGFQAEARATDLHIKWDRTSHVIQKARIGVLTITDGELKREVPLTAAQLQLGSVTYTPVNSSIEMRLEVFSEEGARITEEALAIWMRGGNRPVVPAAPRQAEPSEGGGVPRPAPAKPFVFARSTPPAQRGIQEPPPVLANPVSGPPAAIRNVVRIPPRQPAPPPVETPPALAGEATSGAANGPGPDATTPAPIAAVPVQTTPARPVRRVQPLLAPNIRALLRGDAEVSVRLQVDARGEVVAAEPVGSPEGMPRVLIPPALAAARQWRFEPARTPGGPVPSEFIVRFQFSRNP
jgi:hypothetical protein